jgi:hypothetical protein
MLTCVQGLARAVDGDELVARATTDGYDMHHPGWLHASVGMREHFVGA